MDEEDDDGGGGIPEWVVTFGDMMSLLLTFFIMLVSLSEIKQEEQYQAMVESVLKQFGHDRSHDSMVPGSAKPRNSAVSKTATMGRARKLDIMQGGNRVQAPQGEQTLVNNVRDQFPRAIAAVVYFDGSFDKLTEEGKAALQKLTLAIAGKPQILNVTGHTTYRPLPAGTPYEDNWELGFHRAQVCKDFMVHQLKIDAKRVRILSAGPHEPLYVGSDTKLLAQNPRVEVRVTDELVQDRQGTPQSQQGRFLRPE
ncbi:MAG: flagellar motor protein MotB [Pirellulaceae bacterium]|jgi:chemotaxis protein MotB|nr:flagellar motor protein MotB [Pirellulaceae bacterium]MDP7016068.1 flagellar motor protein MotB [Pirellulaceae bacterium]